MVLNSIDILHIRAFRHILQACLCWDSVAGTSGHPARASVNHRRFPKGRDGQGEGHLLHGPKSPGGGANVLKWAGKGPLIRGAMN